VIWEKIAVPINCLVTRIKRFSKTYVKGKLFFIVQTTGNKIKIQAKLVESFYVYLSVSLLFEPVFTMLCVYLTLQKNAAQYECLSSD